MRLFSRVRELEAQNMDLNRRLEILEECFHKQKVDELVKQLSLKYNLKMDVFFGVNGYYLGLEDRKRICYLPHCKSMKDVYWELYNSEDKIKVFLYDKAKEVAEEILKEEGEKSNDKE